MTPEGERGFGTSAVVGLRLDPEILLAGCIAVAIVLGWIGLARDQSGALAGALMLGILALVTADLVFALEFRRALVAAPDEEEARKDIAREQSRFDALPRPLSVFAGGVAFVILTVWLIFSKPMLAPAWSTWAYSLLGGTLVVGALLWWIGPRVITDAEPKSADEETYSYWPRYSAVVLWLTVPAYLGSTAAEYTSSLAYFLWFARIGGALVFLVALELTVRSGWALAAPRARALPDAPIPTLIGTLLLSGAVSLFLVLVRRPAGAGLAPEGRLAWLGGFLQRSVPRVVIGIAAILWLSTAFSQVGVSRQGVRERFGASTGEVLEPGVHLGWPWPIDRVSQFPARELQVMQIGYVSGTQSQRANLIWTEAHGIEEDRFVTASGREVISFDIDIYWRISDVLKFAYAYRNPESLLRELAYKAIMLRTHGTTTDLLLSRDRGALAHGLREDIQAGCDANGIGIEVAQISIIAIHPPFEVAGAYQEVVSAQVKRDTLAIQASTYHEEIIPAAYAQAQTMKDEAMAYGAGRLATARGESEGFRLLVGAVRSQPLLYRFRRRIEALEEGLPGKRLYVVSKEFVISRGPGDDRGIWFDLR